jgi:hypothetical protein
MITFKRVWPSYNGPCVLTWVNRNSVDRRLHSGVTVFAYRVRPWGPFNSTYGEEFHGMITSKGFIVSTEGMI